MALNLQPPFINPVVPFSCMIKGGLQNGMSITVCGRVLPNADRFNVNLQQGSETVALHVNPRYASWLGPGYVVHNTRQYGKWGWEERKVETPFPKGQTFSLQILVTQASYKISANGKPFSEYKHRIAFSDVDRMCVVGKVELSLVSFHYAAPTHAALPGSLTVPYKTIIHGGLQPGKGIIIQGIISPQAKRVVFSLRHKAGIVLYYSPCFDKKLVVCNSCRNGKWDIEEHSQLMPFERGQAFQVTICCSPRNFEVFVNESDEPPAVQELRMVLIGRSEAGKSSIGNVILGREAFKERRTTESEIQTGRVEDRNISIIDTPGFFNTQLTDEEMREQMMKSLTLAHPGPHVFLLVIRLDRFIEDVVKIVKKIHEHFGKDAFRFTMVLFTGREAMSKREWIEFRLDRKTRELLSFCEEKCDVIIHKNKRDRKQIASLLENMDEVFIKKLKGCGDGGCAEVQEIT
ncbi:galectin-9-like isoform X1 [Labeo rohita]|uniref:Galectin n=1 Tax=Labeo rohita TaxID=84645 RepID=A0A498P3A8_LABRO|nr:galectin-9-like isoform X1 [Labeo rohita]